MKHGELLKGTLDLIILRLLANNERMYGYEITQKVLELTQDRLEIGQSALYPALHRLELEGLLSAEEEFIGKRIRKYYRLTSSGAIQAQKKVEALEDYLKLIDGIVHFKFAFRP